MIAVETYNARLDALLSRMAPADQTDQTNQTNQSAPALSAGEHERAARLQSLQRDLRRLRKELEAELKRARQLQRAAARATQARLGILPMSAGRRFSPWFNLGLRSFQEDDIPAPYYEVVDRIDRMLAILARAQHRGI